MIIGLDVRHLASGPFTGVAAVTRNLVEASVATAPEDDFRIFFSGRGAPPPFVRAWPNAFRNVALVVHRIPNRCIDVAALSVRQPKIDRLLGGVDVLLSPHALPAPLARAPRVLVLHDLSFVAHPEFFSPSSRRWHALMRIRQQAARASVIIVPSRATAFDLKRFWGIPEQKIHIIPWGVSSNVRVSPREVRVSPRSVLFLGTVEKRKNVAGLLRAFEFLKQDPQFADVRLVIAGAMGWGSNVVKSKIQSSKFKNDIALCGYISDAGKSKLLAEASVFVYPSFYEGFGLPVLEAMAQGIPVVSGYGTSLPEVAGNAALLVDPRRPEEIAQAMQEILSDGRLAAELSRRGRERVAQFTWEKTAQRLLGVLREVIE